MNFIENTIKISLLTGLVLCGTSQYLFADQNEQASDSMNTMQEIMMALQSPPQAQPEEQEAQAAFELVNESVATADVQPSSITEESEVQPDTTAELDVQPVDVQQENQIQEPVAA